MTTIDPLASVHPDAQLGEGVAVGPFCVVEADVRIGAGCKLEARASLKSGTRLGRENHIHEGAVLGGRPQHLGAGDEVGRLMIGDKNQIRENVTIHRGLKPGQDTVLGDHNFLMIAAHVGHDCRIGNHVIIANNTMLGGHVTVDDRAFVSASVAVHQFCRIGSLAMVGGQAHVNRDVPPFVIVDGLSSLMVGLNRVGLKRAGFTPQQMTELKAAYRHAFCGDLPWDAMIASLQEKFATEPGSIFAKFLTGGTRGFVRDRRGPRSRTLKLHNAAALTEIRKAG